MIFGRFLGIFFGFLLGGLFGALFGFFIGYHFDRGLLDASTRQRYFTPGPEQQKQFLMATFGVMGYLSKSSGHVSKEEIQVAVYYMDRMSLQGALREQAQAAFRMGKTNDFPLDETLDEIYQIFANQGDVLRFFLEMQLQAAFADGDLTQIEQSILERIAARLHIPRSAFLIMLQIASAQSQAFNGRYQQSSDHAQGHAQGYSREVSLSAAYQLLGVDANASDQQVKKAYRKEMAKHHPDKLAAKGLPTEMMEIAKQKTQEIQEAWELIRQHRGIR